MRIGEREKQVLEAVGIGALLVGAVLMPGLPIALSLFLSKNKYGRGNVQKSIKRLEDKNLIYLSGEKVKLTKEGRVLLKRILSEDITIKKTKWDGIWRIVAYDVPERRKKERDYFRLRLLELGFVEVQKSMYVIPYECLQEIAVFAQSLGLASYVLYMNTGSLPQNEEYKKRFALEL
jgi:DNA-binding transcriptional regulator PaaX